MDTVRRGEGARVRRSGSDGASVRRCEAVSLLILFLVAVLLSACSPPEEPAAPARALPDISSAAEPVQKQIRDRFQSLQAALERKASTAGSWRRRLANGKAVHRRPSITTPRDVCLRNAQQLDPGDMRWPYFLGHVFRYRSDPRGRLPLSNRRWRVRRRTCPASCGWRR